MPGSTSYLLEMLAGSSVAGATIGAFITKLLNKKTDSSKVQEAEVNGAVAVTEVAMNLVRQLERRINSLSSRVTSLEDVNDILKAEYEELNEKYTILQMEHQKLTKENVTLREKVTLLERRREKREK